ncbi:hypothetical protein MAPG_01030 [Magnaporthiopsis poae ATCC 64411]|uniref:Uncharacterized protein n=1 Tax=Magnaporthiopsis poae (strain ATCC 64411 / 73-15) TaxID=644358 RepID=A0A0C4DML9_MAGP6|nr:hypothetical protein MAPG_01030 [Magnaporthiopsis poae ATCC 64411]
MTVFSGALAEAYNAWLDSLSSCYATISPCLNGRNKDPSHQLREKDEFLVLRDQPALTPPPTLGPLTGTTARGEALMGQRPASVRRGKGRGRRGFTVAKRFWSHGSSSSRRPKISAPSNFRHIHSESFQFPPASRPGRRPRSFRPLELSIYVDDHLSPILPHFVSEQSDVFPPAPAHMHSSSFDSNGSTLTHQRTLSSMSFHLQRRPVPRQAGSPSTQDSEDPETPPRIPPRSRMRARSSAEQVDRMVARVASAMLERDRLQAEIESIVERHSIYMSSRPSTAYDMQNLEPMPEIPALPAAGRPSFVERLSIEQISTERPRTAPPKNFVQGAGMEGPIYEVPDVFHIPQMPMQPHTITLSAETMPQRQLAPPLPLVLRPPLRKKRSFSRVSNWLFPADDPVQHQRGMSFDSVTNAPLPTTDRDGFYTCVAPARRTSFETISTSCSWDTQTEERTQPTTMSVTDSPSGKEVRVTTPTGTPRLNRTATFGRTYGYESRQHRPQSVGVAF